MARTKVLVAGASGVVGQAALRHFASLDGWDAVGISRRPPRDVAGATHLPLDLTDAAACRDACASLGDVTHVVYAALYEKPGLVPGWYERDQMGRNLLMLRNLLDPLDAAADLAHVSLLQGTKAYGAHVGQMETPVARIDRATSTPTSTGCRRTTSASCAPADRGRGRSCARRSCSATHSAAT